MVSGQPQYGQHGQPIPVSWRAPCPACMLGMHPPSESGPWGMCLHVPGQYQRSKIPHKDKSLVHHLPSTDQALTARSRLITTDRMCSCPSKPRVVSWDKARLVLWVAVALSLASGGQVRSTSTTTLPLFFLLMQKKSRLPRRKLHRQSLLRTRRGMEHVDGMYMLTQLLDEYS